MSEYNKWRGDRILIRDSPDWKNKYPLGPVHFDVKCAVHDVEYLDISPEELPGKPDEFRALLKCCFK